MLILHILPDLNTGGAEMMMKRLVESQLGDPRYEHRVLSLRGLGTVGPLLQAEGVRVDALGLSSPVRLPATLWRLWRKIRSLRPDIVQTWMYHADLFGGVAARVAGLRAVIWGVRVADISPEIGVARGTFWVRRACARLSRSVPNKIVYVCHSARPPHEALGYDPSKAVVVPNGYVLPPQRTPKEKRALRRRFGLPEDALLIGTAGRWSPQKDFPAFLAAASLVRRKIPAARFVLAGRGLDASNEALAAHISEAELSGHVHLMGERRDIADLFAALDIFALSSIQEGFPNVVAEAMAAGVPCVSTDVGDAAFLIGETGTIVPPRRPDLLAVALVEMAVGSGSREALGQHARGRIEQHFSIEAISARYAELYRDVARS